MAMPPLRDGEREWERERDRSICTLCIPCERCCCLCLQVHAYECIWMLLHYKISTYKFFNTLEQIAIMICRCTQLLLLQFCMRRRLFAYTHIRTLDHISQSHVRARLAHRRIYASLLQNVVVVMPQRIPSNENAQSKIRKICEQINASSMTKAANGFVGILNLEHTNNIFDAPMCCCCVHKLLTANSNCTRISKCLKAATQQTWITPKFD